MGHLTWMVRMSQPELELHEKKKQQGEAASVLSGERAVVAGSSTGKIEGMAAGGELAACVSVGDNKDELEDKPEGKLGTGETVVGHSVVQEWRRMAWKEMEHQKE
ncbi:hypothetical protein V6N12_000566 [Hibiscus sabdariffa]|uniref:Uncharacterized protein n=1 Tax=Hibiscus sabdariffa TaxID=183260 RepID=A0ABR1ZSQ5_9ROSI